MNKMKDFLKNKGVGFYIVIADIIIAIVLGIVFFATYHDAMGNNAAGHVPELIGWFAFIGAVLDIVTILLAKYKFVHILALAAYCVALGHEIFLIPNLIADAVNDVHYQGGDLGTNLFYLISLLIIVISAIVAIFLGLYTKEGEKAVEEEGLMPKKNDFIKIGCSAASIITIALIAGISLGNSSSNPSFVAKDPVVALDDIQKKFEDKVDKNYDFDPKSVVYKEDTHPYLKATPAQVQANVSSDLNRFLHHKVYEFEGKYTEAYQGNFNYTYSYIYLWEDGLYNGIANGSTIYGYWYNRTAEGEPCLVMKGTDGNDMVCESTKGDKYYDYMTDLKTSLNGGRTCKMNGFLYTPAIGIYIDTGSTEEQKVDFLNDLDRSHWKVMEVRNDLRYSAVFNPDEIEWQDIDNMVPGTQDVTASWKEYDDQEEAFTDKVAVIVDEDTATYTFTYADSVKKNYRYVDLFDSTGISVKRTVGTGAEAVSKDMDLSKIAYHFDFENNKIVFDLTNGTKENFAVTFDTSEAGNTIHTTINEKDATIVVTSLTTAKITSDGKTATFKITLTGNKGLATINVGEKISGDDGLIEALPTTFGMNENDAHELTLAAEKFLRSPTKMNAYSQSSDSFVIFTSDPSFVYVIWQFSYNGTDFNQTMKLTYVMNDANNSIELTGVVDGVDTFNQWQWCSNKTLTNLTACSKTDLPFDYAA
jgi:hypothetical protein